MGLKQVFSNEGDFASQEAFDRIWEKGATGVLLETWATAKHPTLHSAVSTAKNYPIPNARNAEGKKQGHSMRCNKVPRGNRSLHF